MSPVSFVQKKWIQILHVAKRELGLDDEAYRAVLSGAAGVESASEIKEWKQYEAVIAAFRSLGFQVQSKTSRENGLKKAVSATSGNPSWITPKQEYYIRGLWDLASLKKDETSLRRMLRRMSGVEDIRFLKKTDAQKVIITLREITKKAGYDPDKPPDRKNEKGS